MLLSTVMCARGGIMEIRRTYSASVPKVLFIVILLLLLMEAPLILFYLSVQSVLSTWIFGTLCFVIVPLLAVLLYFALKIKIEITDLDIRFHRFNRNYMTIPIPMHRLNPHVHRIMLQFVIPLDLLSLKVTYPNGTSVDIKLNCFSIETFDRFSGDLRAMSERMNDLDRDRSISESPGSDAGRNGECDLPFGGVQYTFPKKDFLKLGTTAQEPI
jgi:hypothetical protein